MAVVVDAVRNGGAMRDGEAGHLLELVRGPVAEIERARGAELERIAGGGDVLDVQFRAAADDALERVAVESREGLRRFLDLGEEHCVADERDLDRLDQPGALVRRGQRLEEVGVVDHGEGRGKSADEILFPERVDAVLHADAAIGLAETGGGQANEPNAAMGGGGGESGGVKESAAADRKHVGMAVDAVALDFAVELLDEIAVVFHGFAAGDDERCRDELSAG